MGVLFGVIQNGLSPGNNPVQIPQFPATLIGVESAGIFAVAIVTPARQYIVPFGSEGGIVTKYVPVVLKVEGNQLNTTVLGGSGTLIWLFGTPSPEDSKYPAEVYSGVIGSVSTSQSSGTATVSLTLTFPSGNLRATGIAVLVSAATQAQVSFNTSAGTTLTYAGFSNQVGGQYMICPLDNFMLAQVLSITVTTFAATTAFVVVYYR